MAVTLTGSTSPAVAYAAAKFANGMSAGYAESSAPVIASGITAFTVSFWVKGTNSGSLGIAVSQPGLFWAGHASGGNARFAYGGSNEKTVGTSVNICDGSDHFVAIVVDASGGKIYVDGTLAGSDATSLAASNPNYTGVLCVRELGTGGTGFPFQNVIDTLAFYNAAKYSGNFTAPSTPTSTSDANLLALFYFNSNLTDSAGAASGPSLSSPTITGVGTTSATPGISTDTGTGTLYLVLNTVNTAPNAAQVKAGQDQASASKPNGNQAISSTGAKTQTVSTLSAATTYYPFWVQTDGSGNDSAVTAGTSFTTSAAAATAVTMSGPSSGTVSAPSSNFTIGANGAITGTVVVTPSDGGAGGTFAPTTVSISSGTPTATFTYTAASTGAKAISVTNNGGLSNPSNITFTAAANPTKPMSDPGIVFSPYNWVVDGSPTTAKTICAGAYFRTLFTGASCVINLDISANPSPQYYTRVVIVVDGVTFQRVPVASSINVTMPSNQTNTTHLLEVYFDASSEMVNRWNWPSASALVVTGITLASGSETLSAPTKRPDNMALFGDSITECIASLGGADTLLASSNYSGWPLRLAALLNCEVGVIGFGATGINHSGNGNVSSLGNTWNYQYQGVSRSFVPAPKYCVWLEGQNDGANNTISVGTAILNAMLTAMAGTQFILFKPFSGNQAANLQAMQAGCNEPGRVRYIDTTGYFNPADSMDTLHPYGYTGQASIAPKMAAAILAPAGLNSRTVTVTLTTNGSTPAASLTGLKWAFKDSFTGAVLSQGSTGTTNGSGVFSVSVQSAQASGGTGWLDVTNSDFTTTQTGGCKGFSGPVAVT